MAAARKKWQEAKAKVKHPKNWEAKLDFKDGFGPSLDAFENIASSDLPARLKALGSDLEKLHSAVKRLRDMRESIEKRISASDSPLQPKDRANLKTALSSALKPLLLAYEREVCHPYEAAQMKWSPLADRISDEFE